MARQKFTVDVTKTIEIWFDTSKLDAEFWNDFNTGISDRGGPDLDYLAKHAAWNYVQGDDDSIEGIGDLKEMNIDISEIDSDVEVRT